MRGGIPDVGFADHVTGLFAGKNRVEDIPAMIRKYPFMNGYWEDKIPRFDDIRVPAYVVASWTSPVHTHGTLEAFAKIASGEKWLRVHNTQEWPDFYTPRYTEDLRRFFDRYLKGAENGWEKTPRVRLSILDPGGTDIVDRVEKEYPLSRTVFTKLYLNGAAGTLTHDVPAEESAVRYRGDDGKGRATFSIMFDKDMELTGPMKLRLWVAAEGGEDMDLFVLVQKLSKRGRLLTSQIMTPVNPALRTIVRLLWALRIKKLAGLFFLGATGRLRVSCRELDKERSTPGEPVLRHRREQRLKPEEIVPVEIPIWPMGMRWRTGEKLSVSVTGYDPIDLPLPGIQPMVTRNKGDHVVYTGGRYDSYLQVPVITDLSSEV
jgi:putative CocE/NonD family hydrolase